MVVKMFFKHMNSWTESARTGSNKEAEEESGRIMNFTEEDWERLNKFIGYKESDEEVLITQENGGLLHLYLEVHMKHNASKLLKRDYTYLADLSCDSLDCAVKIYSEAKIFNLKLGSYKLSSPKGLLAEVQIFKHDKLCFRSEDLPFDAFQLFTHNLHFLC